MNAHCIPTLPRSSPLRIAARSSVAFAGALLLACSNADPGRSDAGSSDALEGPSDAGGLDATPEDTEGGLAQGFLQFELVHNLNEPACIDRDQCRLAIERKDDVAGWLGRLDRRSSMPVLHWDRAVPWLVFAEPSPPDRDPVAFFDGRLDPELRAYVDAFADHFRGRDPSYLAVSLLHGERNRLERLRIRDDLEVEIGAPCEALSPSHFVDTIYRDGQVEAPVRFGLRDTYLRFLRYLYAKLQPRYFGLMVEANLYRQMCPEAWSSLVDLYHDLYDTLRVELPTRTRLFATVTFADLLAYDAEACWGGLRPVPCSPPGEAEYPTPDPERCFPLDLAPLADLDEGDRMEILALSFYPDGLQLSPPEGPPLAARLHPDPWDGSTPCQVRAPFPPALDPYAQLDRFPWTKPIALAETSARSCATLIRFDAPTFSGFVRSEATPDSQRFWLELALRAAREREFQFVAWSFLLDYPVIEHPFFTKNVIPNSLLSLFNLWACSGLYTPDGSPTGPATQLWEAALDP